MLQPLPRTSRLLRSCEGESDISRVHVPSARSPQQCTVINSQFLKPSLELSNSLQHSRRGEGSENRRKQLNEEKTAMWMCVFLCWKPLP